MFSAVLNSTSKNSFYVFIAGLWSCSLSWPSHLFYRLSVDFSTLRSQVLHFLASMLKGEYLADHSLGRRERVSTSSFMFTCPSKDWKLPRRLNWQWSTFFLIRWDVSWLYSKTIWLTLSPGAFFVNVLAHQSAGALFYSFLPHSFSLPPLLSFLLLLLLHGTGNWTFALDTEIYS